MVSRQANESHKHRRRVGLELAGILGVAFLIAYAATP
jgi:hypothetical protein